MIDIGLASHVGLILTIFITAGLVIATDVTGRRSFDVSRRAVVVGASVWIAFVTAEFWIFGPYSYLHFADEGMQAFPYYQHVTRQETSGRFDHLALGGTDAYALFSAGYQLISPERLFFAILPSWAAVGVQKIGGTTIAFVSAYLLARRVAPTPRVFAFAIAAAYTLAFHYMINVTLAHGFGHALMAAGVLVFCYRIHSPRYLLECLALGIVVAIELTPVQGGLPFYSAVFITALISGAWRDIRFYAAILGLIVLHVVNWGDMLYAFASFSNFSSRVQRFDQALDLLDEMETQRILFPSLITAVSAAILVLRRDLWWKGLLLCSLPFALAAGLHHMPWNLIGLGMLKGVHFSYIAYSIIPLSVVAGSMAVAATMEGPDSTTLERARVRGPNLLLALLLGIPFGLAVFYKVNNTLYWIGYSSHANLAAVPNLMNPSWLNRDSDRVVAVPHYFSDNNLLSYGFHTFGGYYMLFDWRKMAYWQELGLASRSGRLSLRAPPRSCPGVQDIEALGDTTLLRIANVRYIVSYLPVQTSGVAQVSGPSPASFVPSCEMSARTKVAQYLTNRFHPNEVFVYDLGTPLPRVFFAQHAMTATGRPGEESFWRTVREIGLSRGAVFEAGREVAFRPEFASATVTAWRETLNGFDIDVSAPEGGLLIINSSHLPYWRAYGDTVPLDVVPATGVHMAVPVAPNTRTVVLRYDRWLPSDLLRSAAPGATPESR